MQICKWVPTGKNYPKMVIKWIDVNQVDAQPEIHKPTNKLHHTPSQNNLDLALLIRNKLKQSKLYQYV